MVNLRQLAESDLSVTLEGEWALNITLTGPGGIRQTDVPAQVIYETIEQNASTGEPIIVNKPVVTLRISTLTRVPLDGEKWFVQMPESPLLGAALSSFSFDPNRAIVHGKSIGYMKLYLRKVRQST